MLLKISTISFNVDNLLELYREIVAGDSKKLNLVSRRDVKNLLEKLVDESLLPLEWSDCRLASPVIDIGSGAGLPGIPLKIARPDLRIVLLEANRRKSLFLRKAVATLALEDIEVICRRAERIADDPMFKGQFNSLVSRGTAPLKTLLEWGRSLLGKGGELVAWKGSGVDGELARLDITGWSEPALLRTPTGLTLVRFELLEHQPIPGKTD